MSISNEALNSIAVAIEAYNRPKNRIINMCVLGGSLYTRYISIIKIRC